MLGKTGQATSLLVMVFAGYLKKTAWRLKALIKVAKILKKSDWSFDSRSYSQITVQVCLAINLEIEKRLSNNPSRSY